MASFIARDIADIPEPALWKTLVDPAAGGTLAHMALAQYTAAAEPSPRSAFLLRG